MEIKKKLNASVRLTPKVENVISSEKNLSIYEITRSRIPEGSELQ